eukprot:5906637-Prymnesium_polylepis.1
MSELCSDHSDCLVVTLQPHAPPPYFLLPRLPTLPSRDLLCCGHNEVDAAVRERLIKLKRSARRRCCAAVPTADGLPTCRRPAAAAASRAPLPPTARRASRRAPSHATTARPPRTHRTPRARRDHSLPCDGLSPVAR